MWMCDRCQEINDDNVATCPKCGYANQPENPPAGFSSGAREASVGFDYRQPANPAAIAQPIPAAGKAPTTWDDIRMSLTTRPVLAVCLGLLLAVEAAPAFINGPVSLFGSIPSALLLGPMIVATWKLAHLKSSGVRVTGTVIARRDTPGRYKTPPRAWATVEYVVNGRTYLIKDTYGGHIYNYPQVGDRVPVLYDRALPSLALPELPTAAKWVQLTNLALLGLFLLGLDWTLHYSAQ